MREIKREANEWLRGNDVVEFTTNVVLFTAHHLEPLAATVATPPRFPE